MGGLDAYRKFQSQEFQITLAQLPHVLLEAREIAQGTEYAQALGACGSRFEVSIPDLDAVSMRSIH